MEENKVYGKESEWIVSAVALQNLEDGTSTGTITATFAGTLADARAAAPKKNSCSEFFADDSLKLLSRQFSYADGMTTGIFSYSSSSETNYDLTGSASTVSILAADRFKSEKDTAKEIARCYVSGMTDSTTVWRNMTGTEPKLRDRKPESGSWEEMALGEVADKYAAGSELVKMARKGRFTVPAPKITWTKTELLRNGSLPKFRKLGEIETPESGDGYSPPSGFKWILSSITATPAGYDDNGFAQWSVSTKWETLKQGDADQTGG